MKKAPGMIDWAGLGEETAKEKPKGFLQCRPKRLLAVLNRAAPLRLKWNSARRKGHGLEAEGRISVPLGEQHIRLKIRRSRRTWISFDEAGRIWFPQVPGDIFLSLRSSALPRRSEERKIILRAAEKELLEEGIIWKRPWSGCFLPKEVETVLKAFLHKPSRKDHFCKQLLGEFHRIYDTDSVPEEELEQWRKNAAKLLQDLKKETFG